MESNAREQMAIVERAEAAPYIDYPPTPLWYYPSIGLWVAAMIGTFVWWRENAVLFAGTILVLVALEGAFIAWMSRRHGALPMPGRGNPPREIAAVWRGYFIGLALIVAAIAVVWWLTGPPIAAPAGFVLVTGGLVLYERRYAVAAAKVRERLA
ncbi:hypothetical protein [Kribbella deserti]|uniref:Uncharacterized protein n=1 Tax=Kribbella deserti TaxID=1926257 RepID=A0ABV6QVX2_9ACTN